MRRQNVCSQYPPPVEDNLCVTFGAKSLNESWCQTQDGYTNFDCSLSQPHLPETAVALKNQKYSHTFYRVTPNMCIIYRMRNGCLCWLLLVTVDIIKDWLPQVTELPFCAGVELGHCAAPSTLFSQPYSIKRSFGVLFMVSRVNAYSEWIWCTGTLITYHMYLFRHDQVWRHRMRHMGQ